MKILIAIPTYNNESTIRLVVREVLTTGLDILVINDGSTDKTHNELNEFSEINIISIPENCGKGNALREAFKWAVKNDYTHLISIDADGQHDPAEIPKFVKKIEEDNDCLIMGSRDFSAIGIPFASRLGRKCSNLAFHIITGISLLDTQSGFRAYPLRLMTQLSNKDRYDFEVDMLLNAVFSGIQIKEIKISSHYSQTTKKSSQFKLVSDSIKIVKTLVYSLFS